MKEIMLNEKNPLNGSWLCWIPNTPVAYCLKGSKTAKKFCNEINKAFDEGKLKIDDFGRLVKVD
tara:strand:+ start:1050 stop:1241 length:192 start_codon:yes stop_codon:yes gene_type:complete